MRSCSNQTRLGQPGSLPIETGWRGSEWMYRYRRLFQYILRQWPRLFLIIVLTVAMSGMTVLQPWPLKLLVDHALGDSALPAAVAMFLETFSVESSQTVLIVVAAIASLVVFALGIALETAQTWCWSMAGQRMMYDLAAGLFRRFHQLSLLFHSQRSIGDSLNRLTSDSWSIYEITHGVLIAPVQHGVTIAFIGVVSWRLDSTLTLIALSAMPALSFACFFFGRWLKQVARGRQEAKSRVMAFVQQVLSAIPMVQAYGAEERNNKAFNELAAADIRLSKHKVSLDQAVSILNGTATTLMMAIVVLIGGHRVLDGILTLGSLLVFLAYIQAIHSATRGLLKTYVRLRTAEASVDRVIDILDAKDEVMEAPGARPLPALPAGQRGRVRLDNVNFGYRDRTPVLREIDLEVRPGETLALVGPTGAGKSTLVSLIPRFFDPWDGRVLVDGHDVRELQISSIRAQISIVLQEPFLLPVSVAENIAYGRPDATREDIVAAATVANAHDFIRELPQGYDTILGERGMTLSGGQRQRLAIARALLKDAPILILDEPTSAIDIETEHRILEALERLMLGRTTLIIAHRLSTIRRADRIAVMEDGRIVEIGSHQELMAAKGLYNRLYSLQLIQETAKVSA